MNSRADMVIFHEPDRIEFAGGGKSLGSVRHSEAEAVFCSIRSKPAPLQQSLIENTYAHFSSLKGE